LDAFLAQYGYCNGKWEILDIVDNGMSSKTHILLEYWGFLAKSIDEAWCLLEWFAWDSFEFEKAICVSRYSFPDPYAFYSRSCYALFWCELYNSSDHDTNSYLYYPCYVQLDFASPKDNTDVVLTSRNSSFPLAQCTWLKVGELFREVARFSVTDA